jgi:hypothetical protein
VISFKRLWCFLGLHRYLACESEGGALGLICIRCGRLEWCPCPTCKKLLEGDK